MLSISQTTQAGPFATGIVYEIKVTNACSTVETCLQDFLVILKPLLQNHQIIIADNGSGSITNDYMGVFYYLQHFVSRQSVPKWAFQNF